jgi:DNA invertase Pin-like site-specific DNA recombinase
MVAEAAKREVEKGKPGRPPTLTPAQQERAIMLIRQGMPLQKVAELLETSYDVVYRLAKSEGIELPRAERKLTPEQLREAYGLLGADVPFRQVAKRFGINPESLRRLAERDGVELKAREEKLTLTKRKLTPEQQQEARDLVRSGVSLRQTARMFGISRQALIDLLKDGEDSVEWQHKEPILTLEQQQEACELLQTGASLRRVAKLVGTTHQTLARYLRREEQNS